MKSDELKAISAMLQNTIKDVKEWESRGCPVCGFADNRVGATKTGIQTSISMMRRMLLQISRDLEDVR